MIIYKLIVIVFLLVILQNSCMFFGRLIMKLMVIWLSAGACLNVTSYKLDQLMRSNSIHQMCFMVMCAFKLRGAVVN